MSWLRCGSANLIVSIPDLCLLSYLQHFLTRLIYGFFALFCKLYVCFANLILNNALSALPKINIFALYSYTFKHSTNIISASLLQMYATTDKKWRSESEAVKVNLCMT